MATTQTFYSNTTSNGYKLSLEVRQSAQSIANNTSDIAWVFRLHSTTTACDYNSQQVSASINGQSVYSATRKITIGLNSTLVLASGTLTGVAHNSDGSKTVATAFTWPKTGTGTYLPNATMSGSGNYQLDKIARASSFTIPASTAYGSTMTIAITRADASFTHDITITLPNRTQTYTGVGTSQAFTIPITGTGSANWLEGYTTGQEASGSVTVQTKQGSTLIGSAVSKTFKAPVPSNIVPTVSIARTAFNSGLAGFAEPIQGISTMTLTNTKAGAHGSTITSAVWRSSHTLQSITVNNTNQLAFTVPAANPCYIYCDVTDSRGRTATATYTSWNHAYNPPSGSMTTWRTNSAGNTSAEGQYVMFKPVFSFTALGGGTLNQPTMTVEIPGVQPLASIGYMASGSNRGPIGDNKVLKTSSYTIKVTVTDKVGKSVTLVNEIPVSEVLMNFPSTANALGIGQYSTKANTLEVGWNTEIKGSLNVYGSIRKNGLDLAETYRLGGSDNLDNFNYWTLGTNPGNANATTANKYPIAEAGSLIAIQAAYASANQIYHSFLTNRMFIRGGGSSPTAKTAWTELLSSNNYNSLITALTLSTLTVSGATDAGTSLKADTIGVDNTSSTSGNGISLYGGANAGQPAYGLFFGGTATFGTKANVTGDWATYFTMSGASGRGWIFRNKETGVNVASISNTGYAYFEALRYGSYTMNNTNLNGITENGVFQGYTGMTNAPVQDISVLEVYKYSNDWVLQRFTQILNNYTWQRVKVRGTTWSGWTRIN